MPASELLRDNSSIVAIGDELVGGFTLDSNSHWLAERLRLLGFPVKRMTAIRDRPNEIVEQVARELADPEVTHGFVSGGPRPPTRHRKLASIADAPRRQAASSEAPQRSITRPTVRTHGTPA